MALPHGEAMEVVAAAAGGRGEGDRSLRRLPLQRCRRSTKAWYGLEHTSPHLLAQAVYGLPEINGPRIPAARLVAVPGCYPTAAILALAPLANKGWAGVDGAIIDAKSGVSGAGRSLSLATHFSQADESIKPYNVGKHRHTPEMEMVLSSLAGGSVGLTFTPHLVPMSRGILATCYVRVGKDVSLSGGGGALRGVLCRVPFVVLLGRGRASRRPRRYAAATTATSAGTWTRRRGCSRWPRPSTTW